MGHSQTGTRAPVTWLADAPGGHAMTGADPTPAAAATAMPGMASRQDLQRLGELTGRDAEALFLDLMTAPHQRGVEMAQAVLDRPAPTEVHRRRDHRQFPDRGDHRDAGPAGGQDQQHVTSSRTRSTAAAALALNGVRHLPQRP